MSVEVMYQPYTSSFGYQRNNEHSMQVHGTRIVSYCFLGQCFVRLCCIIIKAGCYAFSHPWTLRSLRYELAE